MKIKILYASEMSELLVQRHSVTSHTTGILRMFLHSKFELYFMLYECSCPVPNIKPTEVVNKCEFSTLVKHSEAVQAE